MTGLQGALTNTAPAAGSTSITTLGTVATGTWHGGAIAPGFGGTGLATYSTGDLLFASARTPSRGSRPARTERC